MVRCFGGWRPLLLYDSMSGAVSRGDTYLSETHCKLRRSAAVGKQTSSHSLGSAKRDLCIVLNIIVDMSVPLRGTIVVGVVVRTHSCAASQLAVGF